MAKETKVIVLLIDGRYWLLQDDGSLVEVAADELPTDALILDGNEASVATHIPGASSASVDFNLLRATVLRTGDEVLPESGFTTYQGRLATKALNLTTPAATKFPPLDPTAELTAVIEDNGDGFINQFEVSLVDFFGTGLRLRDEQLVELVLIDAEGKTLGTSTQIFGERWSLADIDLSSLAQGEVTLIATARDFYGNTVTATDTSIIDTWAVITDNTVLNGGNLLNAVEVLDIDLTGVTEYIGGGRTIDLTFTDQNGASLSASTQLADDGTYVISDLDFSGLADGTITISYRSTDLAGNIATQTTSIVKDTQAAITVVFDGDRRYSSFEIGAVTLSGAASQVEAGQVVTLVITDGVNSATTTALVQVDGRWQSSAVDLTGFNEGNLSAVAEVADIAGNPATASSDALKDTVLAIDIDTGAGLDINLLRAQQAVIISGTTDAEPGQMVLLSFTDTANQQQTFSAQVQADGRWSTSVTITQLGTHLTWMLSASVMDIAGNQASDETPTIVLPNQATLSEDALNDFPDGYPFDTNINITGYDAIRFGSDQTPLTEVTSLGFALVVTVAGDGQSLSAVRPADNQQIISAAINSDGTITVTLYGPVDQAPLATQTLTSLLIEATQQDADSTSETVLAKVPVSIREGGGSFAVDDVFNGFENRLITDNVLTNDDHIEAPLRTVAILFDGTIHRVRESQPVFLSTLYGDMQLNSDGSWSLLAESIFGSSPVQFSFDYFAIDSDGDLDRATVVVNIVNDPRGAELDAFIDDHGDNFINQYEVSAVDLLGAAVDIHDGHYLAVTLTDSQGTTLSLSTNAMDDKWSIADVDLSVLAQGLLTLVVSATDNFGNTISASDTSIIDTLAVINADLTSSGGILLNGTEVLNLTFNGSTAEIGPGREVQLTITDSANNQVNVFGTIASDNSFQIANVNLSSMADGLIQIVMRSVDLAGNMAFQNASFIKDTQASVQVVFDGDQRYSTFEVGAITLSGSVTNVEPGRTVTVTVSDGVNSQSTTAIVLANGTYQTGAVDITGFNDGNLSASAQVTDIAGNPATGSATAVKDTQASIVVQFDGDRLYSSSEIGAVSLSGTVANVEVGQTVTVTVTDGVHSQSTTTQVLAGGVWNTSALNLTGFNEGTLTANAGVTDVAGNTASNSNIATKDTLAAIAVTFDGDQLYSASEIGAVTLSGTVTNVENGQTVTVVVTDGVHSQSVTAVVAGGAWQTTALNLTGYNEGTVTATASVMDVAGNTATNTDTAIKDTLVAIDIDTGVGLSIAQLRAGSPTLISGTTDAEAGQMVTVTIADALNNQISFNATVQAGGSWSTTATVTGLNNVSAWTLNASVTDRAGNSASDATPTLIQPTEVVLSESALVNSPAGYTMPSTIRIHDYSSARFSSTQLDLAQVKSLGSAVNIAVAADGQSLMATRVSDGQQVLGAQINGDGTISVTLYAPVEQAALSDVLRTSLQLEATQVDADSTSETVIAKVPVNIRDTGEFTYDDAYSATEAVQTSGNVFTNDNRAEGPLQLVSITVEGQTHAVAVGSPAIVSTTKGQLTVNSDGSWTLLPARNLDNTVLQQLQFDYSALDQDKDFDSATVTIGIGDGAAGSFPNSVHEETEENYGAGGGLTVNFVVSAGSDNLLPATIAFSETQLGLMTSLNYTSNGLAISYSLESGNTLLRATAGGNTVFTLEISSVAGTNGNLNGTGILTQLLPLDHIASDTLSFPLVAVATDIDGTEAVSSATLNINDGARPGSSSAAINLSEDNLAPIVVNDSIQVQIGSDQIKSLLFINNNQPAITSGGETILYNVENAGQRLVAYTTNLADPVFVVEFTGTPAATTDSSVPYIFTLYKALDQLPNNPLSLALAYRIIDFDDDRFTGHLTINVSDSTPAAGVDVAMQLSESPQAAPNIAVATSGSVDFNLTATKDPITQISIGFSDGAAALDASGRQLTVNGSPLVWRQVSPSVWEAKTSSGTSILRAAVPDIDIAAGTSQAVPLTVTVLSALDHLASNGTSLNNLTVNIPVKFIDSDGTTTTLNGAISIYDGRDPVGQSLDTLAVDEDDTYNGATSATGLGYATPGSDKTVAVQLSLTSPVTSHGVAVALASTPSSDGWWIATAGGSEVFRVKIGLDGKTEFRLSRALDHANGNGENTLGLTFDVVLRDADGDLSAPRTLTVNVTDDIPDASDRALELTEGYDKSISILADHRDGADGAEVTTIRYTPFGGSTQNYTFNANKDPIVITLIHDATNDGIENGVAYGTFTVNADGTGQVTTDSTLSASFTDSMQIDVTDFDGDLVVRDIFLNVVDEAGSINLSPLQTAEDTPLILTLSASPGDLDQNEVITSLVFAATGLRGGTLTLNGNSLFDSGSGNWILQGTDLTIDPVTGVAQPNGTLIFTPALNTSDPTDDVVFNVTMNIASTGGPRSQTESFDVSVTPVVDEPVWDGASQYTYNMNEDAVPPALNLSANLFDTDGSEVLTYRIENIGADLTLKSGSRTITNGSTLSAAEMGALTISVAANAAGVRNFTAIAIATESSTGESDEVPQTVTLNIAPVADVPTVAANASVQSLEDQLIPLSSFITGSLKDTDGSETLSFQLTMPTGWSVVDVNGAELGLVSPGVYRVTAAQLSGNQAFVKPLEDISSTTNGDFTISVISIATESTVDGIAPSLVEAQSAARNVTVKLTGVVDLPAIDTGSTGWVFDQAAGTITATFAEDGQGLALGLVPLNFVVSSQDDDGSESMDLVITGIPQGVLLTNSAGVLALLPVVGEQNGFPLYAVTSAQLSSLYIRPPVDFSGLLSFHIYQTNTEPDGDSESYDIAVNINLTPVVDTANGISVGSQGAEDTDIRLNFTPSLADVDGSETVTNVTLQSLPAGALLIFDGNVVAVPGGGLDLRAFATANGTDFATLINSGRLAIRPPEDSGDDLTLNVIYEVTDTSNTGVTAIANITGTLAIDVVAIVDDGAEENTRIEGTDTLLVSADGSAIDLSGSAIFTEADIDGSEYLDYIMISLPEADGWYITHPNGALHDGKGNWMIQALGTSTSTVDIIDLLNGATIISDHINNAPIDVLVSARVIDTTENDDADILSDVIQVQFLAPGNLGTVQAVSTLQTSTIDGLEGSAVDLSAHLDGAVHGDGDDIVSFRIDAADIPYGGAITGADVEVQYAGDGTTVIAYWFTKASLGNLQLVGMDEDFAGVTSMLVYKISTDPLGASRVDTETLAIQIGPVVDTVSNVPGLEMQEDVPARLNINLQALLGDNSTLASEGLETVTSLKILTPTDGSIVDPNNLLVAEAGGYRLNDPSRINEIYYRPPLNKHGSFSLDVELTVTDTTTGLTLGSLQNPVTQVVPKSIAITVTAVTDAAPVIVADQTGNEDSYIALTGLNVVDTDQDGSETLALSIRGVPEGAVLFWDNGGTRVQLTNNGADGTGNYVWSFSQSQIGNLVLLPPPDFAGDLTLTLESVSMELSTQEIVSNTKSFVVAINPIADGAQFTQVATDVEVNEGDAIIVGVYAKAIEANNPNETVVVRIFVAGTSDASATQSLIGIRSSDGKVSTFRADAGGYSATLVTTLALVDSIQMFAGSNAFGRLDVDISVGSQDSATVGGVVKTDQTSVGAMNTQSISIDINPLPDPPLLTRPGDTIITTDTSIPLGLQLTPENPAPGETSDILISGLPSSINLSADTKAGEQWTVAAADVSGLSITNAVAGQNYTLIIEPRSTLNGETVSGNQQSLEVDVLTPGNNTLTGTSGIDYLIGGSGNDTMTGAAGADDFVFRTADLGSVGTPANDTIGDFNIGEGDQLRFTNISVGVGTSISFVEAAGSTSMSIDLGSGVVQTINLTSVTKDDLYGADSSSATDNDILQKMIADQTLVTGA